MNKAEKEIANEAFMMGRVYNRMGEKENPAEIHQKLFERCERIAKNYHTTKTMRLRLKAFIQTLLRKASHSVKRCTTFIL